MPFTEGIWQEVKRAYPLPLTWLRIEATIQITLGSKEM